jgi:hypothetical protein
VRTRFTGSIPDASDQYLRIVVDRGRLQVQPLLTRISWREVVQHRSELGELGLELVGRRGRRIDGAWNASM